MKQFDPPSRIQRREFLRLFGLISGAAGLAAFLNACERAGLDPGIISTPVGEKPPPSTIPPPTAKPETTADVPTAEQNPPPTEKTVVPQDEPGAAKIALVKTSDRMEGVRRAIAMLGMNPVENRDVFIKPNFNSADPPPGSTHPDVLRALVLQLREMGARKIKVGDRSGMGDTRQVMTQLGIFDLAEELGFETIVFDELKAQDWIKLTSPDSHWSQGYAFPKVILESESLVQTCCLKTHRYGGHFTLSLKNSVGMVAKHIPGEGYNYMSELHDSPHQRMMIAEINSAYQPALVVLDGVEAFVDRGPDQGTLVRPEVVLAGIDRVAIDAIGVAILRYFGTTPEVANGEIFRLEQIARAVELGLGVGSPNMINILTGDQASDSFGAALVDILKSG